ncbi:protein translocase subunit SecD [Coraliomargarita akajimensis]|uniref:Multifunctional fusion protein n=1 Tax=Coraliomargarita akajimensis (strain DSM 45221 / IAM 15411 / JCM 23193 / KCTC 12865 / 04OKA010-24) TaxID=583355 RepID=D5EKA5_CORAD|nr:protein translocase subunit SecD [Coraliomargarita akajimensis]ADE54854.1 protein-export membrane protein SecD [Coraliomargarita akajimensis DSM 45221]
MSGNILWKFILTVAIILWCIASITPLQDRPFEDYIISQATANADEFEAIVERAHLRVEESRDAEGKTSKTLFIALREIGQEEAIDYASFFPEVNLTDVANQNKRNNILLKHMLKTAQSQLRLGLDLKGGVGVTMKVDEAATEGMSQFQQAEQLKDAIRIMGDRLDGSGVAEPIIRPKGDTAIEIQMPGLSTKENPEIIDVIKKPARLEFRSVHPSKTPYNTAKEDYPSPYEYEVLVMENEDRKTGQVAETEMFIKRIPEATGEIVKDAYAYPNQAGGFEIHLEMTDEGSDVLRSVTERMVGKPLAIVLDGKLYSAPTVNSVLSKNAQITGSFSQREAIDLANVLNNPLALPLAVDEMYEVGPSMAEDARDSSINAVKVGATLVVLFMVAYYFIGGLVAVISALINVVIVLGVLASLGATLTLPGVAALVLTLGMGVDANILIFERLREELKAGKTIKNAAAGAFQKVTSTIVDANVTTLITACILIWLGTGPVKGFGYTLAIGICASIFCALIVTRFMIDFLVYRLNMSKVLGLNFGGNFNIDFFKFRKPAFIASWLLVAAGVVSVVIHHDNIMGIDFTGGDEMTIAFDERIAASELNVAAEELELGEVNPVYQTLIGSGEEVLKIQTRFDQSRDVLVGLQAAFPSANLQEVGMNQIGASVSNDIQWNALWSVVAALGGILLYVAFRFEVGYGVGAVVATIHDVLMTVGVFVLCGELGIFVSGQFSAPMLAAILMIVGYSINDTIVVFDRIREELELNPGAGLRHIINMAISRVFSRSLLTSITTLLAAVSLYIFGAGVINDFSFVFIIGILTGTFSSIFIASPVFYWWHKGDRRHVEERELTPKKYEWEAEEA